MQYNYCSSVNTIEVNIILTRKTNVFVCKKRELETKMIHTECSLLYSSRKTAWQFIIYFSCQLQCAVLWKTSLILHMVDFLRGNICQLHFRGCEVFVLCVRHCSIAVTHAKAVNVCHISAGLQAVKAAQTSVTASQAPYWCVSILVSKWCGAS